LPPRSDDGFGKYMFLNRNVGNLLIIKYSYRYSFCNIAIMYQPKSGKSLRNFMAIE